MATLNRLAPKDEHGAWRAVIETPQGSRHKLKFDPKEQAFAVACTLPAGMSFPFDFGFFPRTRAEDGDPLDVLVLMDGPASPGCLVSVRMLGVIEADQTERDGRSERNDRLVALGEGSTERGDLRSLKDMDPALIKQLETFFVTYNQLFGKSFRIRAVRGPRTAERLIRRAALHRSQRRTGS